MAQVRVRFAPSPTGYLHVGGARTALYNWLFARQQGGVLILRIEDTDPDRSKPELEAVILESLNWLGLSWDEGPFRQSERLDRYGEMAAELERRGAAYRCFCAPETPQEEGGATEAEDRPSKHDCRCRSLDESDRERLRAGDRSSALRFRVPEEGTTAFEDRVFGRIEFVNREIEDYVLLRSDGQPTYHLGVVADDLDMRVTDVIRGADHIPNTPKQLLIYQALGVQPPRFAHLPLILGPDKQRLSKRHGATSVGAYRDQGILPEALVNFLALLGWAPPAKSGEAREILTLQEMLDEFRLEDVSRSNAVFDLDKLAWMNAEYLRKVAPERLMPLVEGELRNSGLWSDQLASERERFEASVRLLQSRARTLKDFSGTGRAFFSDEFPYDLEAVRKFWRDPTLAGLLEALAQFLSQVEPFDLEGTERSLRSLAEEKAIKAGLLINAARVALTGQAVAPSLFEVMVVLGRDRVVNRLKQASAFLQQAAPPPAAPPAQ
ncbi:MAG TPA: glutamate--tRNA ligase [Terriglobia bacterium]|nr:glutamate--tRNA ligase [Terriglobia bacterium]